jgi:outer membrane protein
MRSRLPSARAAALVALALAPTAARAQTPPPPAPPPPARAIPAAPPPAPEERVVSLADAVTHALTRNVTAVVAAEEIHRFEAIAREVRAAWLPALVGNGVYTRLDDDRKLADRTIAAQDAVSANLTLTVPLVHPQRWAAWSHAKDAVDVARASQTDAHRQVALATGRAYLAVIAQKRALDVVTRARDTAKAHYDFAHARLTGGVGNRIDEVRAAQELATDEAQVLTTRAGVIRTREALGVLMGVEHPVDVMDEPGLAEPPALAPGLADARARRADVKLYEKRVEAADHAVRDDWTDYSPYLVAVAQPFYQNPASLTQPLTGWQAQLVLTLPLYDGGLRYGLAKERDAIAAEARAGLEGALRQAKSDVRTAFEALRAADQGLVAAKQAASLAKQALDLANLAYQAGATTNLEVIDAERRARDAETQAVIAEDAARQARLDLLSAAGRFP